MSSFVKLAVPLAAVLGLAACNAGGSSSVPAGSSQFGTHTNQLPASTTHKLTPACSGSRIGRGRCDVLIESTGVRADIVYGWEPANLEAAYNLPSKTKGSGQVVAIVDAFDNPNVASDLAAYRSYFGLPAAKFYKYNQKGQRSNYPSGDTGWGVEIDLDVQMVSAACPLCTIYLIEANSNYNTDLEAAEREAVKLGATIVSNSYSGTGASESYYDTPGVTYLASAGDNGYGLYDPATFDDVVAVGGTVLTLNNSTYSETVWADSGGGCSSLDEAKPSWQTIKKDCAYRIGNDIAAVAYDAAEYDSYGESGWITVAGTSISSPLMAGVFGLAGNSTSQHGGKKFWTLSKTQLQNDLHAITSGDVTNCPSKLANTYLCKAGTNQFGQYSGPTGWGSPKGIGAF